METMDLALRTDFLPEELEALFKYIPSSQLLTLREVSRECDEAAEMVLRKRRDIKLNLTTDNFDGRSNWEFLKFLMNSPEAFVAPVMHIKNENKSVWNLWNLEEGEGRICGTFHIIQEICERLGNRGIIRKLIIEDGDNAPHFTSDFVFALLNNLSSLEVLQITELQLNAVVTEQINPKFQLPFLKKVHFQYGYRSDEKEAGNLFKIILESSPNLEIVTGWDLHELDAIAMLRDTGRLSKMKGVILKKATDLDILLQCKPKVVLHFLQIETEDEDFIDSKKLFTFLQQQSANLKSFRFDTQCLVAESIFTMPVLPVLEKLSFKSWSHGCLPSVNYGKETPALKALEICSSTADDFPSWEEFLFYEISSEMPPCLSLEEMELDTVGGVGQTNLKVYENWKILFPNVKKLHFGNPEEFDIEQFSKCWPKLETLSLRIDGSDEWDRDDEKDLDELLFGIKIDGKKWIYKKEEEWWMKIPTPVITTTVANLRNLKELEIYVHGYAGTVILTDLAVYFGLKRMENLRKLEISYISHGFDAADMKDLSTEAFNFLVKNLPKLEKLDVLGQKWERGEILQ